MTLHGVLLALVFALFAAGGALAVFRAVRGRRSSIG